MVGAQGLGGPPGNAGGSAVGGPASACGGAVLQGGHAAATGWGHAAPASGPGPRGGSWDGQLGAPAGSIAGPGALAPPA